MPRRPGINPVLNRRVVVGHILPRALVGALAVNIFLGVPAILFGGPLAFGLVATAGCVGVGIWCGRDLRARKRLGMPPFENEIPRIR